jgi:hypothetical protein
MRDTRVQVKGSLKCFVGEELGISALEGCFLKGGSCDAHPNIALEYG